MAWLLLALICPPDLDRSGICASRCPRGLFQIIKRGAERGPRLIYTLLWGLTTSAQREWSSRGGRPGVGLPELAGGDTVMLPSSGSSHLLPSTASAGQQLCSSWLTALVVVPKDLRTSRFRSSFFTGTLCSSPPQPSLCLSSTFPHTLLPIRAHPFSSHVLSVRLFHLQVK